MIHTALILLAIAAASQVPTEAPDVAVVVAPRLRDAMETWIRHRQGQGHRMAMVAGNRSVSEIREDLRAIAQGGRLRYVVLVGDADPAMYSDSEVAAR